MKIRCIIQITLALILFGSISFAQGGGGERGLLVEVRDAGGRPLKSACVTFVPKEGEIIFGNTDSRGHIRLKKPEAASYRVIVKADGYQAQKREVAIGTESEIVAFAMQPRDQNNR